LTTDRTSFLIIGSGIAGLRAAIGLGGAGSVTILTKADPGESNTLYAQGGIAAAIGDDDSPALHASDTTRAGDGLCDEAAVAVLVEEGVVYVRELLKWGTRFDRDTDGRLALGREAAHTVRRVLHARDATGREIRRVLWERTRDLASVVMIRDALVTQLIVEDRVVLGARYFDRTGQFHEVRAKATLLATGGAGQVFRETTNPPVATGDGIALAFLAGARVADLEFIQFHPTALNRPDAPRFLISEALRGEGARLVNRHGEPFMARYHPGGDLAPRDIVARSIIHEVGRTGGTVYLTLAHLDRDYVRQRFPTIAEMCLRVGLDLARDLIPVGPAAHYVMGGVDADEWARTSVPALFAAGEVACTGVHGANRLASNSLLEGLVFGARAAIAMQEPPAAAPLKADRKAPAAISHDDEPVTGASAANPDEEPNYAGKELDVSSVRDLMWRSAGLFRTRAGLQGALSRLNSAYDAEDGSKATASPGEHWRRFNLIAVARLIVRAALRREESRGGHFRADFPERDDRKWRVHIVDQRF
jgi:L-aspartate oxidase